LPIKRSAIGPLAEGFVNPAIANHFPKPYVLGPDQAFFVCTAQSILGRIKTLMGCTSALVDSFNIDDNVIVLHIISPQESFKIFCAFVYTLFYYFHDAFFKSAFG